MRSSYFPVKSLFIEPVGLALLAITNNHFAQASYVISNRELAFYFFDTTFASQGSLSKEDFVIEANHHLNHSDCFDNLFFRSGSFFGWKTELP